MRLGRHLFYRVRALFAFENSDGRIFFGANVHATQKFSADRSKTRKNTHEISQSSKERMSQHTSPIGTLALEITAARIFSDPGEEHPLK
jgi:hypothetical protein